MRANLETFLAQAEAEAHARSVGQGARYPRFVERELRRFLDCGIPANGFARLRCPDCGHERIVAFSCKGRCLCPSCMARRMAATAAELVDQRLPAVPYRQWVLTLPFALRFALASNRRFLSAVIRAKLETIFAWLRSRARDLADDPARLREAILLPETTGTAVSAAAETAPAHASEPAHAPVDLAVDIAKLDLTRIDLRHAHPGAVTFLQRFGSAINLHPHSHSPLTDGLFVPADADDPDSPLLFIELPPPTDLEVAELLRAIAARILRVARRFRIPELTLRKLERQLGVRPMDDCAGDPGDDDFATSPDDQDDPSEDDPDKALLEQTLAHALTPPLRPAPPPAGSPALAEPAPAPGTLELKLGDNSPDGSTSAWTPPPDNLPPPLCARIAGFSLHAGRCVETHDRPGLERLCRYGLRPPFAAERLSILPDGRIQYDLPKPWTTRDGRRTHELILEPIDFMRRLAALVPPPYFNTVRYHGVLASRNKLHQRLPLPPPSIAALATREALIARNAETDTPPEKTAPCSQAGLPLQDYDPAVGHPIVTVQAASPSLQSAQAQGSCSDPTEDSGAGDPTQAQALHGAATASVSATGAADTKAAQKTPAPSKHSRKNTGWAALLMRTLGIDALKCTTQGCAGRMTVLAFLTDPRILVRVLEHIGLPSSPPPLAPPRLPSDPELDFDLYRDSNVYSCDAAEHEQPMDWDARPPPHPPPSPRRCEAACSYRSASPHGDDHGADPLGLGLSLDCEDGH